MWRNFGIPDRFALGGDSDLESGASETAHRNIVIEDDDPLVPANGVTLYDLWLVAKVFEFLADALVYVHLVATVLGDIGLGCRDS